MLKKRGHPVCCIFYVGLWLMESVLPMSVTNMVSTRAITLNLCVFSYG